MLIQSQVKCRQQRAAYLHDQSERQRLQANVERFALGWWARVFAKSKRANMKYASVLIQKSWRGKQGRSQFKGHKTDRLNQFMYQVRLSPSSLSLSPSLSLFALKSGLPLN